MKVFSSSAPFRVTLCACFDFEMRYRNRSTRLLLAPIRASGNPSIHCMTEPSWSPHAGASASANERVNLSQVFAGQKIGIREISEKIWLVSFMHYDLGFFHEEADRVECAENPFGAKVLPIIRYLCDRNGPEINGRGDRI